MGTYRDVTPTFGKENVALNGNYGYVVDSRF